MTTKKRRFIRRAFQLILGVTVVVVAWNLFTRWRELRDLTGRWQGWAVRTTPSGAILAWDAELVLWKSDSGTWAGTFEYRDGWRTDWVCVGRLVQQSSGDDGLVFTETESNCPAGQLRARRSGEGLLAVSRSGGGEEGPGTFQAEFPGMGGKRSLLMADTIMARAPREPWQVLRMGDTVRGALAPDDAESWSAGAFDTFLYAGDPGTPIVLRVKSDSLQPVVDWGAMVGGRWVELDTEASEIGTGEFGHGGVAVTPRTLGDYGFRLTAGGGRQGSYTLTVEPGRAPARMVGWLPRLEREGEVAGRLQASDSTLAPPTDWAGNTRLDPLPYDTYAFFAVAGDRLTLTMRSAELAPVLWIGTVEGGTFVPLKSSTAGGNEAVLRFIPAEHGDYVVRAGSLAPRKEGAYTIRTDDAFPDSTPGR